MGKEEELHRILLEVFSGEAEERLQSLTSGFLELEKGAVGTEKTDLLETVFRDAHSLKGAARAVCWTDIVAICQALETLLSLWKKTGTVPGAEIFDKLHRVIEGMKELLTGSMEGQESLSSEIVELLGSLDTGGEKLISTSDTSEELRQIPPEQNQPEPSQAEQPHPEKPQSEKKETVTGKAVGPETVRISMAKLDSILRQAEELLTVKLVTAQRAGEIRQLKDSFDHWQVRWANISHFLNPPSGKLSDFLLWQQDQIRLMEEQLSELKKKTEEDHQFLGRRVDNLLDDTKKVMLFPVSSILQAFPRMVRDISREQKKEVNLVVQGDEFEVDKRILEEMKDPLIHLVRNCIDHGIENPEERERWKKPREATISITISPRESDKIEIVVADDGIGIDQERVKASAVKKGLISSEEAEKYNEQEALSLIFQSEVSTSKLITQMSGRGLGMAIVRERVDKIGGSISIDTEPADGTTFKIVLPLTLATFRGVLLRAGDQLFVVPTINVERVGKVRPEEIKTIENKDTINHQGCTLPLVELADVLGMTQNSEASKTVPFVILNAGDRSIAFRVQNILNEEEVLVKGLGRQLVRVRNIGGATVLGSGQVVIVLNVSDLLKSALRTTSEPIIRDSFVEEEKKENKRVLVVEDSITSRMLLKNILESAEYIVKTAVDGIEAFLTLKIEEFDLVVSDIEMPRMNGFELTSRIRNEEKLSEIPVVLVTALESREDRERGIDVGADAYIVKSSFDQSNLLEVVGRLI
jgi:two-component system, chemotaxis family, sensor kinase CheA